MVAESSAAVHGDRSYARERTGRRPPTRRRVVVTFGIVALLLFIVFGGFAAFNRFREQQIHAFFAHNVPPPVPVAVAVARSEAVPRSLGGIGGLTAVRQVVVAPELGGRVTKIFFTAGAAVKQGDPLVQLNDEVERGDLANFQAQARLAEVTLQRARALAARQVGPQANVDTAQSQLDQARAEIARTQALIDEKLIRAPFSGVLGIRQVELGQYVNAGMALVTLTDLDTLYVNFTLPEQDRAKLAIDQTVDVAVDAYPGKSFTAKLTAIEPQISADTRTIKLQATLPNPGRTLLPGMSAKARVVLPPQPDVITVPATALDHSLYGDAVYRIVDEEKPGSGEAKPHLSVKRVFVRAGEHFGDKIAILEGLTPGERVVTSGQIKLHDGAAVTINTAADVLTPPATPPLN